ncbi:MAG: tyrosine--tRNA ligase [Deltaproteobacteria bacterium]|nr:tyrosine--tRNA ligase [Deltaproteobacteria bacterium]
MSGERPPHTHPLLQELSWRGLIFDATEGVDEALSAAGAAGYIGFDPTADSLHVGNLLAIMGLVHLQRHGVTPIALVGGATGMVGDPSGKSSERNLLDEERLAHNVSCIRAQLARFLDFERPGNPARLLNNADWLGQMGFIEFLRDVGKHFPLGYMLAKDSVKRRVEGAGISFTEFSYMLLQAYDFAHLNAHHGCVVQLGGSDQWGNITAGVELMRRMRGARGHGLVFPLVTTATGQKFGKTEAGAVWLDAARTSPYQFYQFWLNAPDDDVERHLKRFTLLSREALSALMAEHAAAPHLRAAQRALARDVTRRVHGEAALAQAERAAQAMFGGDLSALSARELEEVFADVPSTQLERGFFEGPEATLGGLLVRCGVCASKAEARRLVEGGGVSLNDARCADARAPVSLADAVEGRVFVIKRGAKRYHLARVE